MIFTFGDSWTAKTNYYGETYSPYKVWPELLDKESKNFAWPGASNKEILEQVVEATINYPIAKVDKVIVAFTSIARLTLNPSVNMELCIADHPEYPWYESVQKVVFEKAGLTQLLHDCNLGLHAIESMVKNTWGCKIHFIPVFEDCEFWRSKENFLQHSLINILFNEENKRYFMYDCPVYEFGFLQDANVNGKEWANKHLDSNWHKAHFERSNFTLTSALFDDTQHPNQQGHRVLAKYFNQLLG
tara:strand:+ start:639 stop:1370 length:732 start_codon:yes stop_codon:yes gene_type:complete